MSLFEYYNKFRFNEELIQNHKYYSVVIKWDY
jgi:hypothetical protein